MRATDTMTREVTVVVPEFPLRAAWNLMRRDRIRHLPIARDGILLGMLSDRDVLLRATRREDGSIDVPEEPVGLAMQESPVTCEEDASLAQIVRAMTEHKIDAIAVVADDNRLVGLVTSTDLLLLLLDGVPPTRLPFDFSLNAI